MANSRHDLFEDLRRRLEGALKGQPTNTAARRNVVVSTNVGQDGATHHAVAAQVAPIRQEGSDSRERGNRHGH